MKNSQKERRLNVTEYDRLQKAFNCGVGFGLLLAEEERDREDLFEALKCRIHSKEMCLPSVTTHRRKPRDSEWRQEVRDSYLEFLGMCGTLTPVNREASLDKKGLLLCSTL
jgi:hypothetical protein